MLILVLNKPFHYGLLSISVVKTDHCLTGFQFFFLAEDNNDVPPLDNLYSDSKIECDIVFFDYFPVSLADTVRAFASFR